MNQKGFTNALLLAIVVVVIIGAIGFFALKQKADLVQQKTQSVAEQTQQVVAREDSGAEDSGLPDKPAGAKFCQNQENQVQEATYGEKLAISSDKKSILLNGRVAVSIAELPTTIPVSVGNSFNVTNSEFTSAVLSPTRSLVAFTVSGGTHGWGGIKNVFSGLTSPISFQFEGAINDPKWSYDGQYLVFSKAMPKGVNLLALVNVQDRGTMVSEYEKVLDFEALNPQTFTMDQEYKNNRANQGGVVTDMRSHFWSTNNDHNVYSSVVSKGTKEHAELWRINADTGKWDLVCSQY